MASPRVKANGKLSRTSRPWHPHPQGWGSGVVLPCCTRHAPSIATKTRGAFWAVTWSADPWERGQRKELLVGEGGRVPVPVPLTGRPQTRTQRVKLMHPTRRIRRIMTRRHIKALNGDPRRTYKPEQSPQYPLLACAKNSTPLPLHLASCHGAVACNTDTWPLHISRQADSLHPPPQFRCLQGSHPAGALKCTHAAQWQVQANAEIVLSYRGGVSK